MAAKVAKVTTRFRTQTSFELVKKAARLSRVSLNEFVIRAAEDAAKKTVTNSVIENNPEAA